MPYYVYILANQRRTVVYTGVTNDLLRRVWEHKQKLLPDSFTARYSVDQLVYFESTDSRYAAIAREKQIKSWNRRRKNQLVETQNPHWSDLFPTLT